MPFVGDSLQSCPPHRRDRTVVTTLQDFLQKDITSLSGSCRVLIMCNEGLDESLRAARNNNKARGLLLDLDNLITGLDFTYSAVVTIAGAVPTIVTVDSGNW